MQAANRVAKNTIVQYIQLALNIIVGLYSVRVILRALGTEDYGLYDVVAGVIGLLSFISNSLVQTSIRFVSVSMGKGNVQETNNTFNSCLYLHVIIGVFLVFIFEILSFFIFDGFLNINQNRVETAKVLYQCMLLTLFLNIVQTPFRAIIMSNEKFVYLSFIGILDSFLKLAIAYAVVYYDKDKLCLYGILMACITVVNYLCIHAYCKIKYAGYVRMKLIPLNEINKVVGFAGWTLLDTLGSILNRQGYSILLNKFFGTNINSVFALSRQVEGHMCTISSSAMVTIKPQIMKSYGAGDTDRMLRLSLTSGKVGFTLMALVSIPMIVMMPQVLQLWLGDVPEGTVEFSRLLIVASMGIQLTQGLFYANQAQGNVKMFSIIVSLCRMTALPVSCVFLYLGYPPLSAIIIFTIFELLGALSRAIVLSMLIKDFHVLDFVHSVVFKILPPLIIAVTSCYVVYNALSGIVGLIGGFIVGNFLYLISVYYFGLTKEEKLTVDGLIKSFLRKLHSK